jgi:Zn-dependent peptidase ImmA (M78 family)
MISFADIEKEAVKVRKQHDIETYGIKDVFSLIERMDINLIRYPFGKGVLCGLSTVFEGKKVIVSNSSEILTREIFTIAHELGHLLYDFEVYEHDMKVDFDINSVNESISEKRAHYFAGCLLMPKTKLLEYLDFELNKDPVKNPEKLRGLDIVRIQMEFSTSYSATLTRLKELGLITRSHQRRLYDEREMYSSASLFKMINADERLLKPAEEIRIPARFLEFAISNYQNGYVPFSSLSKALGLVGIDASVFKQEASNQRDDTSQDYILQEFEE